MTPRKLYKLGDEEHTLREWAKIRGLKVSTLHQRISAKWPLERALNTRSLDRTMPPRLMAERTAAANGITTEEADARIEAAIQALREQVIVKKESSNGNEAG